MLKRFCCAVLGVLICVGLSFAQWQTPENVGDVVNSDMDEVRACISPDGKTLYFSSNRDGRMDVWMATKVVDEWQNLTKLPSPINTDDDDWLAHISSDGDSMFFISDRSPSLDYDVYKSWKNGGNWQQPLLLPPPVNSDFTE